MKKIRVILTDHFKIYRSGIRQALEKYEDIEIIDEAGNGIELFARLKRHQPDIVITDIPMPMMNGLATIRALKLVYPAIKIMVLTMYDDPQMILKTVQLGANAYLLKSATPEKIYEAIIACHPNGLFINDTLGEAVTQQQVNATHPLSPGKREAQILKLLAAGEATAAISNRQDLSIRTTAALINRMQGKAGVADITGLIEYAKGKQLV